MLAERPPDVVLLAEGLEVNTAFVSIFASAASVDELLAAVPLADLLVAVTLLVALTVLFKKGMMVVRGEPTT